MFNKSSIGLLSNPVDKTESSEPLIPGGPV